MTAPIRANYDGGVLSGRALAALEKALPAYLRRQRWFAGKARKIVSCGITETIPVFRKASPSPLEASLVFLEVRYADGFRQTYLLTVAAAWGARARDIMRSEPASVMAPMVLAGAAGAVYDAALEPGFCTALLTAMAGRRRLEGLRGSVRASSSASLSGMPERSLLRLTPCVSKAEQSNTSVRFGGRFIFKLLRRVEDGINPDLEIGRYLTERTRFRSVPGLGGYLEYSGPQGSLSTLGLLQDYAPGARDGWKHTLKALSGRSAGVPASYLGFVRELAALTARLHKALDAGKGVPDFSPEPMTRRHWASIRKDMISLSREMRSALRRRMKALPPEIRTEAGELAALAGGIEGKFRAFSPGTAPLRLIRCHGDLHLGQILLSRGRIFFIDFEGEPARPLSWRRSRRCALADVAGMLRSFDYAAHAAGLTAPASAKERLASAAEDRSRALTGTFLKEYMRRTRGTDFVPGEPDRFLALLDAYLLEKACYELLYELNNRPDWAAIPIRGLLGILRRKGDRQA